MTRLPTALILAAGSLALLMLSGCSTLTTTTKQAFNASSAGLESSTDISITKPEGYP